MRCAAPGGSSVRQVTSDARTPAVSVPDTKDWTWVLQRRCPQCGFDAGTLPADRIAPTLLDAVARLAAALERPDALQRPERDVWSPLEYACHVRDMCRVFDARLQRMLAEDGPAFDSWDQDATAVEDDYASQPVDAVRAQVQHDAGLLAGRYAAVPDDAWSRTGARSDGATFTVLSLGRYMTHDAVHHVWDVTGVRC